MLPPARLRPLRPEDREAVGQIAFQTGFFGESAARYFPAPRLFALLWVGPYFRSPQPLGFVAEAGGQVVGYVLGAVNARQYRSALWRTVLAGVWGALPGMGELLVCLRYLLRAARYPAPHADDGLYPAHLHINLLPAARGQHLGEQLLQAYLQDLQRRGVPGVQLSTTSENRAALGLYRKLGFQVAASRTTPLWTPWLGKAAEQVVMARRLAAQYSEPQAAAEG